MDMGNHGQAAVMAEAFLQNLDGIEVGLGRGVGLEFAEKVPVEIIQFVTTLGAFAKVAAVGLGDFGEGLVIELVFPFEPRHAKSESRLTGGEVDGLAGQPKSGGGQEEESADERNEARDGGLHGQRLAKVCLWWPSRGLMALK